MSKAGGKKKRNSSKGGSNPRFLAVDFFCGAGGTTRGLIDAGGYVIAGIDKDIRCERTFAENNVNERLDHAPARFLTYDVFPKTKDYPYGQQKELTIELDRLISCYRRKAPRVPLLFAICAPWALASDSGDGAESPA